MFFSLVFDSFQEIIFIFIFYLLVILSIFRKDGVIVMEHKMKLEQSYKRQEGESNSSFKYNRSIVLFSNVEDSREVPIMEVLQFDEHKLPINI